MAQQALGQAQPEPFFRALFEGVTDFLNDPNAEVRSITKGLVRISCVSRSSFLQIIIIEHGVGSSLLDLNLFRACRVRGFFSAVWPGIQPVPFASLS
jgi:hypothetical protein